MSIGFMVAFPLVGASCSRRAGELLGRRSASSARRARAGRVVAGPIVAGERSDCELDGDAPSSESDRAQPHDSGRWARRFARRHSGSLRWPARLYGLVASGIGLFNESILARARVRARHVLHRARRHGDHGTGRQLRGWRACADGSRCERSSSSRWSCWRPGWPRLPASRRQRR